jgi:hypothetical protein
MFQAGFVFIIPSGSVQDNHYTIFLNDPPPDGDALLITLTSQQLYYPTRVYEARTNLFGSSSLSKRSYLCCHRARIEPTYLLRELWNRRIFEAVGNVRPRDLHDMIMCLRECPATEPEILRFLRSPQIDISAFDP